MDILLRRLAKRRLLTSNQLKKDAIPQPTAFWLRGYYPGSAAVRLFRVEFKRKLQTLPFDYFAPTLTRLQGGFPLESFKDRALRGRRLQRLPEAPSFTARTLTGQGYPAWQIKQFHVRFDRRLQQLPVSVGFFRYKSAVAAQPVSAWTPRFNKIRQTDRTLQKLVHPPKTPLKPATTLLAAIIPPKTFRVEFKRKIQPVIDPLDRRVVRSQHRAHHNQQLVIRELRSRRHQFAQPSPGMFFTTSIKAATPAVIREEKARRVRFDVRQQKLPEHNVWTPKAPIVTTISATHLAKPQKIRPSKLRDIEYVGIVVSTLSQPTFPSIVLRGFFRRHQKRYQRKEEVLSYYAPKPAIPAQPEAAFRAPKQFFTKAVIKRRDDPLLSYYKTTPSPVTSWTWIRSLKRRQTVRVLQRLKELNQYTQTPPRVFTYSALIQERALRRRQTTFKTTALHVISKAREAPDIEVAFRSGFKPRQAYMEGTISEVGYFSSAMQDAAYFVSGFKTRTAYLEGDMTDTVYLEGTIDGI